MRAIGVAPLSPNTMPAASFVANASPPTPAQGVARGALRPASPSLRDLPSEARCASAAHHALVTKTRVPRDTKTFKPTVDLTKTLSRFYRPNQLAFMGFDDVDSLPPLQQPAIACAGHAGFVMKLIAPLLQFVSYACRAW
jgi:hypothetical protein